MVIVESPDGLELDICTTCKVLYFDPRELQALTESSGAPSDVHPAPAPAPPAEPPVPDPAGLRDALLTFAREDWKLIIGLLIATLFVYVVLYDGPDRARCAVTCKQSGYAAYRLQPAFDGNHKNHPARCYCLTEAEAQTTQGVPRGVEVSF